MNEWSLLPSNSGKFQYLNFPTEVSRKVFVRDMDNLKEQLNRMPKDRYNVTSDRLSLLSFSVGKFMCLRHYG